MADFFNKRTEDINDVSPIRFPGSVPLQQDPDIKYYPGDVNLVTLAKRFGLNYTNIVKYNDADRAFEARDQQDYENSFPKSALGTPVFNRVSMSLDENGQNGLIDLDECIIRVNQTKNIVKTPINGYRGTVKELLGINDYDISISGLIANSFANGYDKGNIKAFLNIMKYSDDVYIGNDYLSTIFDINRVVIMDYELAQSEQLSNVVFFRFNCLSNDNFPVAY